LPANVFSFIAAMGIAGPDDAIAATCKPLSERAAKAFNACNKRRYWIGLAGGPGAGKTTVSAALAKQLHDTHGIETQVITMDGYHYRRSVLDSMPDPERAHRFRGASFTFDSERFVKELAASTCPDAESASLLFPGFDHAEGDPIEDAVSIPEDFTGIVFVEGLYLLLAEKPWASAKDCFDETWFLNVDREEARQRVAVRNAEAWGWDMDRSLARVDDNDIPNYDRVVADKSRADLVVESMCGTN